MILKMSVQRLFSTRKCVFGLINSSLTNNRKGLNKSCRSFSSLFQPVNKIKEIKEVNFCRKCLFKTSSKKDALPPAILVGLSRVAKFGAVLAGRIFRRWWQKLPPEERARYARKVKKSRYVISGILGGCVFGGFIYYETHIQETPFTKRKRFLAFTEKQFNDMAKYELDMLLELYKDKIIPATVNLLSYRRVVNVAQRLLKANTDLSQFHEKEWTITVVDDDKQCNAFVLPCGSVFVFSGLLKICETDDELAVILGHEMAHAVLGHGAEKASFLHFLDLAMIIPLAAIWALLPSDATAAITHWITSTITEVLMELPHSRFIEQEADQVGIMLTAKACFDPRFAPSLWQKMALTHTEFPIEWLSTHPNHENREAMLEELIPLALVVRQEHNCPRLPQYDAKQRILEYKTKLEKNKKTNEGLMIPIKV